MRQLTLFALVLGLVGSIGLSAMADEKAAMTKGKYDFVGTDINGKKHSSADLKDKVVVMEWFCPSCPAVKPKYDAKVMQKLQDKYTKKKVVWLTVASNRGETADHLKKFVKANGVKSTVILDSTGEIGKLFGAKKTPHMFVLNKGQLAYEGAFDDRKTGVNFVAAALDEILDGKPVSNAKTRPYG